jgi:hypothetical protein
MIGLFSTYSDIYLYIVGVAMLVGYGLPLIFAPQWWAGIFGWKIPEEKRLAVFLAQSVGILLTVISAFAFLVPGSPEVKPFFFNFLLTILGGMTLLHIYGAIRKLQPKMETWEILLWIILFFLTLGFYPG